MGFFSGDPSSMPHGVPTGKEEYYDWFEKVGANFASQWESTLGKTSFNLVRNLSNPHESSDLVPVDQLQKVFPGHKFSSPMKREDAQDQVDQTMYRQEMNEIANSGSGLGFITQLGTGLVAGALDPTNYLGAAAFGKLAGLVAPQLLSLSVATKGLGINKGISKLAELTTARALAAEEGLPLTTALGMMTAENVAMEAPNVYLQKKMGQEYDTFDGFTSVIGGSLALGLLLHGSPRLLKLHERHKNLLKEGGTEGGLSDSLGKNEYPVMLKNYSDLYSGKYDANIDRKFSLGEYKFDELPVDENGDIVFKNMEGQEARRLYGVTDKALDLGISSEHLDADHPNPGFVATDNPYVAYKVALDNRRVAVQNGVATVDLSNMKLKAFSRAVPEAEKAELINKISVTGEVKSQLKKATTYKEMEQVIQDAAYKKDIPHASLDAFYTHFEDAGYDGYHVVGGDFFEGITGETLPARNNFILFNKQATMGKIKLLDETKIMSQVPSARGLPGETLDPLVNIRAELRKTGMNVPEPVPQRQVAYEFESRPGETFNEAFREKFATAAGNEDYIPGDIERAGAIEKPVVEPDEAAALNRLRQDMKNYENMENLSPAAKKEFEGAKRVEKINAEAETVLAIIQKTEPCRY